MKRRVFIADTARVLLLFLLYTENLTGRNIYIMGKELDEGIFNRLKGLKICKGYTGKDLMQSKSLPEIMQIRQRFALIIDNIKKGKLDLYGLGHTFWNHYVFNTLPLNLLEDGLANVMYFKAAPKGLKQWRKWYSEKMRFWLRNKLGKVNKRVKPFGEVKAINQANFICTKELSKQLNALPLQREIIDLKALWAKKSRAEKDYINEVFQLDPKTLPLDKEGYTVVFTQPLSEDRIVDEAEKIAIYREILEQYQGCKIILKPHPREKTKYDDIFPQVEIWQGNYPLELGLVQGVKIKRGVTLFSTAILMLDQDIPKDIYGILGNEKIINYFGSKVENLLPVTAYLNR